VVLGGLLAIATLFLNVNPKNPPGFYRDESAIAYNAYTISQSGKDEYGGRFPLFFKSYGDYKSPLYVYLLSGVFRVTGPSTHAARALSAVLGLAAVLVLYLLALEISRRKLIALFVALLASLSPWLFEISRLVFEVAAEPVLLALFLFVLYRAATRAWRYRESVLLGVLLAGIAYAYQTGRILAPGFALGLLFFYRRDRRRQLAAAWGVFVALLLPVAVYALVHPGALEARYHAVTWIRGSMPPWEIAWRFLVHYGRDINLWSWLRHGDANERHHVPGDGSLFFVEVALALTGTVLVLLRRRSDPWWRFVLYAVLVSPIAAALTNEDVHSLRMIALPVLLPVLAIPALEAVASLRPRPRLAVAAVLTLALAVEAVNWQVVFHRHGPERQDAFEAQIHPVIEAAFRHGGTVYAYRSIHTTGTDAQFYGAVAGRPASSIVLLDDGQKPPPGSVVVGVLGDCNSCKQIAVDDGWEAYLTPS